MSFHKVLLRSYNETSIAEMDKVILENEGIQTSIENNNFGAAMDGSVTVNLLVRACDRSLALAVLDTAHQESEAEEDDEEDEHWRCPRCHSSNISEYRPFLWISLLIFPLIFLGMLIKSRYCTACRLKFK